MIGARITAIGTYVPEKALTNFDLEQMVETNNEWIIQRTDIHERRITRPDEFTSDLCAACAGFVYALHTAHSYIASGLHKKILVIGADTLSKITDYTDRSTCILFGDGDGAGAVLVERDE